LILIQTPCEEVGGMKRSSIRLEEEDEEGEEAGDCVKVRALASGIQGVGEEELTE